MILLSILKKELDTKRKFILPIEIVTNLKVPI